MWREPTQARVRATLNAVGGYWRPLAAVARLSEELGELAEILVSPAPDEGKLAGELADLWIITTAVADQFLGEVGEPDTHPRRTSTSRDLTIELLLAAGPIARIVNYYDGPKTPRSLNGWVSLSDAVADFHRALARLAHAHAVDLAGAVNAKLRAIPALDAGRFAQSEHDPSTAECLDRLDPDAGCSRAWGAPVWSAESFAENVAAIVPSLTSFTKAAVPERIDGYVIVGPPPGSAELPADWPERLLRELASRDPRHESSAHEGDRPSICFNGLRMSVTVLSPHCVVLHPHGVDGDAPTRRHPS